MARSLVPSMRTYRVAVAAIETRVEMLRVAAMVRTDGPKAVAGSSEPHATGAFTYREIPGGFEIESKLVVKNQPLKVTCRSAGEAIPF
jgi:hypothetical protein